jgi:hypothetical protein
MTAHDLISDIFKRHQDGVPGNERRITRRQLDLLRQLIGEDEEGGAMRPGMGLGFAWMPSGRDKYTVSESAGGRITLARFSNLVPSGAGKLFDA